MAVSHKADNWYRLALVPIFMAAWPLLTLCLCFNYAAVALIAQRRKFGRTSIQQQRGTILLTGAANPFGLSLARACSRVGYKVIWADLNGTGTLSAAKWSRVIARQYNLPALSAVGDASYIARCIHVIVRNEDVNVWVNCSDEISPGMAAIAKEEIEDNTKCKCFAASIDEDGKIGTKEAFLNFLRASDLPGPETHKVSSRSQIHNVLNNAQGKKQYLLTSTNKSKGVSPRMILPRRTLSQTYHDVSLFKLNPDSHLVLEEFVDTSNSYQCLVLMANGLVEQFHARKETADGYEIVQRETALWQAMNRCAATVAENLGPTCSTYLLLRFGLSEKVTHAGVVQQVLLTEARFGIDPDFVLSISKQGFLEMAQSYQSSGHGASNGIQKVISLHHEVTTKAVNSNGLDLNTLQYFLADDIIFLLLKPTIGLLSRRVGLQEVLRGVAIFFQHLLFREEVLYDFWDPLPAYWQYAVAFPLMLLRQ